MLNSKYLLLNIQNRFSKIDIDGIIFLIISYESLLSKTEIIHTKTTVADVPRRSNHLLCRIGILFTTLLIKGVDVKTVSRLLGHSKTSTTLNIYAAITKEGYDKAESVLNGKTPVTVPDSE